MITRYASSMGIPILPSPPLRGGAPSVAGSQGEANL
jgi:hypothetical protein